MADKVIYAPKNYIQIYNALEGYLAGSGSGFTNFNVGSRIRHVLEAFALVSGQTHYTFYQSLIDAVPVALYEGFNFARLGGDSASGFVDFGLTDPAAVRTFYPAGIQIQSGGHSYTSSLPFVIEVGDTQQSVVIPAILDPSEFSDQGNYNATTDTPAIPAAAGANKGHFYIVNVAGTPPPPAPAEIQTPLSAGDWVVSDGTQWVIATPGGAVPIIAIEAGAASNISSGDIDSLNGFGGFEGDDYDLDFVKATTDISGGTDEESDAARRERFLVFVNGLTRSTVNGLLQGTLEVAGVKNASVFENFPSRGYVTIYVDDGTGSPNPPLFATIGLKLNGNPSDPINYPGYRAAGIQLNITNPTRVEVEFSIQLKIDQATTSQPAQIEALAESAVLAYCNNLKLGEDVIMTEVTTACQNSHPDIIDAIIQTMEVDAIPIVPPANQSIPFNQVAKCIGVTMSSVLVPRYD